MITRLSTMANFANVSFQALVVVLWDDVMKHRREELWFPATGFVRVIKYEAAC